MMLTSRFIMNAAINSCDRCGGYTKEIGRACGGDPSVTKSCVVCHRRVKYRSSTVVSGGWR
jgi:hypothetical protein